MNRPLLLSAVDHAETPGMTSHWVGDDAGGEGLVLAFASTRTCIAVATAQGGDGSLVGARCELQRPTSACPARLRWKLAPNAASLPVFARASHVALNVFPDDRAGSDFAARFDSDRTDKFAEIAFEFGLGGAPLLERAIATFECESGQTDDGLVFDGNVRRYRRPPGTTPNDRTTSND